MITAVLRRDVRKAAEDVRRRSGERHHRRPTIITTNLAYPEWQGFLGNRPLTDALLSRLRERCHTVKIDGPCLRAQQG